MWVLEPHVGESSPLVQRETDDLKLVVKKLVEVFEM